MQTYMNSRYQWNKIVICSLKKAWLFKLRHYLQSFVSITIQQSQVDGSLYLQQPCSDHKGEASLDAQVETDGDAGEDEVVPSISPSNTQRQKILRV